jgi:hypothetical protein
VADRGLERGRERDLIEAGLNEAAAMASESKKFQSQWSSTVARLECAHNLDVTARMLLYGESRFLSGCGLRAVRRSPATTSAFRARQQPSSCRRQVSATGLRKVAMPPRGRWFEIVLVTSSPAPLICLHRSMHSKRADQPQACRGSLGAQEAPMPRQRLRSILKNRFARKSPSKGQKPANSIT